MLAFITRERVPRWGLRLKVQLQRSLPVWKGDKIKSLIIPKFVYVSLLLPTPKEVIKQLNQLLFKFLWKGVDKVTRLSATNEYENGGLKMIDFETMVKATCLA